MPYVNVNGVRLNYIQIDNPNGCQPADLVMIHGLATSMGFWYFQHALQFSNQYRVTLYDLRGHGRSEQTADGYTPGNMSIDLSQLLDHLGIARAHFIAHSFGGGVALNLACRNQERFQSLVLVDSHIAAVRRKPNGFSWKYGEKIQFFLKRHGIELDVHEPYCGYKLLSLAAVMHKNNIKMDEELEEVLRPAIGHFSRSAGTQWLRLLQTTRAGQELMGDDGLTLERLRELKFPILAMYGEHSQAMSTGRRLLQVWPHAEFYKMRDAGHFFPVTRPAKFMACCRRFLTNSTAEVPRRSGDNGQRFFRSDRFYTRDGVAWFVNTRESAHIGPFSSFDEAKGYLLNKLGHMAVAPRAVG